MPAAFVELQLRKIFLLNPDGAYRIRGSGNSYAEIG